MANPLDIRVGSQVTKFNETFQWSHKHIKGDDLEKLRLVGDPLADEALSHLGPGDKITNMPNMASAHPAVQALHRQVTTVPSWVDFDQILRGQTLFWSYQPLCMGILLNASLVGGFGAKRVTSTLQCTNYLANRDTAWKRMVETAFMVQDVMSFGTLGVGGTGWRAALKVRLMHAQVRRHVLRQSKYDQEANGIPINQEDLLSTLMVFSTTVIYSLRRLGVDVSEQDAEDYVATWRYVGYIMGVDHLHHFKSYRDTLVLKESVMVHLLDPDSSCAELANTVIEACENRPPLFLSKGASCALTRRLLGDEWADRLGLPKSWIQSYLVDFRISFTRLTLRAGNVMNQAWLIHNIQTVSYIVLRAQLGNKKPSYEFGPSNPELAYSRTSEISNGLVLLYGLAIFLISFLNSTSVSR
ncbi:hypothetical protein DSO57_1028871 [Entomophthora muscae]|uniref:Uncharacterized protein n=1 Tax=Entomophthora muscae TaxID=34485 RepID=A0ACC2RG34_9FUNG|nr:hypothetical protein DSO57_1028871 [Entomophthora muscae]